MNRKAKNKITIYLSDDMISLLRSSYKGTAVSQMVSRALRVYHQMSHLAVVELTSTEDISFITTLHISQLENVNSTNLIVEKNNALQVDYERLGGGEFDLKVLGIFRTKELAINFLDYIKQERISNGKVLYNIADYENRKVVVKVDGDKWNRFLTICNSKNLSYHKVIVKLMSKFSSKYDNQ